MCAEEELGQLAYGTVLELCALNSGFKARKTCEGTPRNKNCVAATDVVLFLHHNFALEFLELSRSHPPSIIVLVIRQQCTD